MTYQLFDVKYLSVALSAWILLYVAFSARYLIGRNTSSLILNGDQRLVREQRYNDNDRIIVESLSPLKSFNSFTNEDSGYSNKIIKEVLESNTLRGTYTTKVNSIIRNILTNVTQVKKNTQDSSRQIMPVFKHAPDNGASIRFKSVPSVQKTIRNRMENYSAGTKGSGNNGTSAVRETIETKNLEIKQTGPAKNDTLINSIISKPGSKIERSSDKKGADIYKNKPDPNAYYNYSKTIITPVNHEFLITNKELCKTSSPELIILVPSSPHHFEKRNAIRYTHGTLSRDRKSYISGNNVEFVVRTVFIVGKASYAQITDGVYEENKKHEDIVLIDYIDSYRNLTKKVLHAFKWVNDFCSNVSYVMKADEDVFINVAVLTKRLKEHKYIKNSKVFGYVYSGYRPVARTGKWAVTYGEFPLESFPDYMSGTSYTMTINLIPKVLYTAQRLPFLPIEDALVTGVIANRIHGAQMVHWKDNSYWNNKKPVPCNFMKGHLSMTNMTPLLMKEYWSILISNGTRPDGTRCRLK